LQLVISYILIVRSRTITNSPKILLLNYFDRVHSFVRRNPFS